LSYSSHVIFICLSQELSLAPWVGMPCSNAANTTVTYINATSDVNVTATFNATANTNMTTSRWAGVICHSGRVVALTLGNMGLEGPLSDSLGNLTMLQTLSLADNNMTGRIQECHDNDDDDGSDDDDDAKHIVTHIVTN
jgi:hypothetical protein